MPDEKSFKPKSKSSLPRLDYDPALEDDTDTGTEGSGGEEGGDRILWQSDIDVAQLLPAERAALLDKIARGMIAEGHLNYGPKAIKALAETKPKTSPEATRQLSNASAGGGGLQLKTHPIVPKGSGLQPTVSPEWQSTDLSQKADQRDALLNKHKMSLKLGQKLEQKIKHDYKPAPKIEHRFNPKPPGF